MHLFTLEGNIGAGKSTLIHHLRLIKCVGELPVVFLPEPVNIWEQVVDEQGRNMLQLFYSDQVKYSFAFQMMAFISRYCLLEDAIKANPGAVIVTERSLFTDYYVFATMLFETGCMSSVEHAIYKKWFDRFNRFRLSGIIYLKCDPTVALARCTSRNREGESVDLAYLTLCDQKHEWINDDETPLLQLDANQAINEDLIEDWVDTICLFMMEETVQPRDYTFIKTACLLLPFLFYCNAVFYNRVVGN